MFDMLPCFLYPKTDFLCHLDLFIYGFPFISLFNQNICFRILHSIRDKNSEKELNLLRIWWRSESCLSSFNRHQIK
jgi:hypothetical protein